jgi:hypothetical protein
LRVVTYAGGGTRHRPVRYADIPVRLDKHVDCFERHPIDAVLIRLKGCAAPRGPSRGISMPGTGDDVGADE